MTPRIPKVIPKDGKVWRPTKESWDALWDYDSDPNIAIEKLVKIVSEIPHTPTPNNIAGPPKVMPNTECKFNEKNLKETIKSTMEEVLRPFMGS